MLILLNHAGPLEGSLEANYELYQGPSATYDTTPNNTNNILNTKDSVNLKRCVSSNYKNKTNLKILLMFILKFHFYMLLLYKAYNLYIFHDQKIFDIKGI